MDIYRTFLAIIISFVILIGYQYFFVGFGPAEAPVETTVVQTETVATDTAVKEKAQVAAVSAPTSQAVAAGTMERPDREARTVTVDTDLYTASLSENGGVIESFVLKDYKETGADNSPGMEMVKVDGSQGFPLGFSWGSVAPAATFYEAGASEVAFQGNTGNLVMKGRGNGLEIERNYSFSEDSYVMELAVRVKNVSSGVLQGTAALHQSNQPFRESGPGS